MSEARTGGERTAVSHMPASVAAWGLGTLLHPLGARRVGRAHVLRRWFIRSHADLDLGYDDWFDPAAVALVDAVVGLDEVAPALDRFATARAAAGFDLLDAVRDIAALSAVLPPRHRLRLTTAEVRRTLVMAWDRAPTPAASSSTSGVGWIESTLVPSAVLEARVRAACERGTTRLGSAAGPTLLVVDGSPTGDGDSLAVASVRWLGELFPAGEVLGALSPERFVAVVHSHPPVPDPADLLAVVLRSSPGVTDVFVRSGPWPRDVDAALAVVAALAPAGVGAGVTVLPVPAAASGTAASESEREPLPAARLGASAARLAHGARTWVAMGAAAAVGFALLVVGGPAGGPAGHVAGGNQSALAPVAPTRAAPRSTSGGGAVRSSTRTVGGGHSGPPVSHPGTATPTPAPPTAHQPRPPSGGQPPFVDLPISEPSFLAPIDNALRRAVLLIPQSTPSPKALAPSFNNNQAGLLAGLINRLLPTH